jgi:signal transduction histidine kinase
MTGSVRWKLARIALADTAIALIPPLWMWSIGTPWNQLGPSLGMSLVYAHVIGTLGHLVMPRAWILTGCRPTPWMWGLRGLALLVVAITGSLVACLIFLGLGWIGGSEFWTFYGYNLRLCIILTVTAGTLAGIYESMRHRLDEATLALRTRELDRERALKTATEARLASLESRVHPHFLFNTLNSISSLIPEDPKRAERLVEQMAALLRFSLDSARAGLVPLESEMKIVGDYLDIEKARFGPRLEFEIDVPHDLNGASVPPLAIQTLVENSVKFVVSPSRLGGRIRVFGERSQGTVRIRVEDSGPGFDLAQAPAGHGIDNLQHRLSTLFGDSAALAVSRHNGTSAVVLTIPGSANGHAGLPG